MKKDMKKVFEKNDIIIVEDTDGKRFVLTDEWYDKEFEVSYIPEKNYEEFCQNLSEVVDDSFDKGSNEQLSDQINQEYEDDLYKSEWGE